MRAHEYEGVVHIHSVYSDGSGTIEEIMQAATELELDFAIITDHNTLKARADGYEGYYFNASGHPTLCLISYEANDLYDQNHYLALGVSKTVHKRKLASEYVEAVREVGGFGVIAHPHEQRDASRNIRRFLGRSGAPVSTALKFGIKCQNGWKA